MNICKKRINTAIQKFVKEYEKNKKDIHIGVICSSCGDFDNWKKKNNLIEDVGSDQKYNVEKILALKPDVIFTNYISSLMFFVTFNWT